MQVDLIKNLPPEIAFEIILRLPVRTICISKCVSKPWLSLLESPDFVNFHLSKSPPGVVLSQILTIKKKYRYLASLNDRRGSFNFDFPYAHRLLGSANGLLCLIEVSESPQNFYICNPVTHNFISVPCPRMNNSTVFEMGTFGFGVSRKTGEFKLVKVFQEFITSNGIYTHSECEVYTLGKGPWRSIAPGDMFTGIIPHSSPPGLFLNGNLYWLVVDSHNRKYIRCFDLETERFSTFSPPCYGDYLPRLCIMEDCLCYCYKSTNCDISLWLMTEDGGVKSWTKPVTGVQSHYFPRGFDLIVDLKDGDILIGVGFHIRLLNYSNRSGVVKATDLVAMEGKDGVRAVRYTPSFVSLRPFSRGCDSESYDSWNHISRTAL